MQYLIELLGCHAVMLKKIFRKMPLIQVKVVKLPLASLIYVERVYPHFSCHHLHLNDHKIYVPHNFCLFRTLFLCYLIIYLFFRVFRGILTSCR